MEKVGDHVVIPCVVVEVEEETEHVTLETEEIDPATGVPNRFRVHSSQVD